MSRYLCCLLLSLLASLCHATSLDLSQGPARSAIDPGAGLGVERAERQGDHITVIFKVADGYSLYQRSLSFTSQGRRIEPLWMSEPTPKHDPAFGTVQVYHTASEVRLPLVTDPVLTVRYQGCLDTGLCLEEQTTAVTIAGDLPIKLKAPDPSPIWVYLIAGVLLALTPCVLPTLPLVLHAITEGSARKGVRVQLGAIYATANALVYAALGLAIGYLGGSFDVRAMLQHPGPILAVSAMLVLMAYLNMGWRLPLPGWLHFGLASQLAQGIKGGSRAGAALMGVMSTLMLSACVSAPLAGILVYIAAEGNPLRAASSLFLLSIGMSLPLLLLASGGRRYLPRSGPWLQIVKEASALLLAGSALINLSKLLSGSELLVGLGLTVLALSVYVKLRWPASWSKLVGTLIVFSMLTYALACVKGGYDGQDDWRRPLVQKVVVVDATVDAIKPLEALIQRPGPKVVLISADWCLNCKVLDRKLSESGLKAAYPAVTWIQLDITQSTAEKNAWLKDRGLFGPPAILFFNGGGHEEQRLRLLGEMSVDEVERSLGQIVNLP